MSRELRKARAVRIGFFCVGSIFLASIFFGWPLIVTIAALVVASTLAAYTQLGLKCANCGVSYFFDPSTNGWNITGVNLFKPASARCGKCGAARP